MQKGIYPRQFSFSSKNTMVIAISAALFVCLEYLSGLSPLRIITFLPIVILGVLPFWFGWSGLVGSMIGCLAGGFFMGITPFTLLEVFTVLIIYGLNWLLVPRVSDITKNRAKKLFFAYATSLFLGSIYHWITFAFFFSPLSLQWYFYLLFVSLFLNLTIEIAICPILAKRLNGWLKYWGITPSNFSEWRCERKVTTTKMLKAVADSLEILPAHD
jgi:hypothetical protein